MKSTILVYAVCQIFLLAACNDPERETNPDIETADSADDEKKLIGLVSKYPDSISFRENLVMFYRNSGNYDKAIFEIDNAIHHDSLQARLWESKAKLHYENEDTILAIRSLEKAISLIPETKYLVGLGNLYAQTNNSKALQIASLLLKSGHPESAKDAYYITGLYYTFNNEKEKAIAFFDKCLNLQFSFMDAYREKAIALYDLGKYDASLAVLDKALTLQNSFEEGYYYSGRCLEKLNRKEEAIQSYRNALVYDPEYVEAKDALNRLLHVAN